MRKGVYVILLYEPGIHRFVPARDERGKVVVAPTYTDMCSIRSDYIGKGYMTDYEYQQRSVRSRG